VSKTHLYMNAWREILARVFAETRTQTNVSPEWLVNPATRRRLKLDYLFPDIGVAVRFTGLMAKGQRRKSDWEILEERQRDETRAELCRLHGIQLAVIDPLEEPAKQMDRLLTVLGRASRLLSQDGARRSRRRAAMAALARAQREANHLRQRLSRRPTQTVATLAEAWRDREAGLAAALDDTPPPTPQVPEGHWAALLDLTPGDRVAHERFGQGVVTRVQGEGDARRITVLFDGDRERSLLIRLAADKLRLPNRTSGQPLQETGPSTGSPP